MLLRAEVNEDGTLRIKSPSLKPGDEVVLSTIDSESMGTKENWWEKLQEVFDESDRLDIPRRTHEEIIRELHDLRG